MHVAAEYGNVAAVGLLLDRGADVNARATVDEAGVGGQTAIFHAVTQFDDDGLPVTQLLVERGADLTLRVKLPGDYERPGEIVDGSREKFAKDLFCSTAAYYFFSGEILSLWSLQDVQIVDGQALLFGKAVSRACRRADRIISDGLWRTGHFGYGVGLLLAQATNPCG